MRHIAMSRLNALILSGTLSFLLSAGVWGEASDAMDFAEVTDNPTPPERQAYQARDGRTLYYRKYTGSGATDNLIVMLHGSGYHSGYLQPLAATLAQQGIARVYTPDLRGHGPDPVRRGDVEYIGQLEDDLDDFLHLVRQAHPNARLLLAGHSSGGGLVIRHAGGDPEVTADGYILLAPYIHHNAPTNADSNSNWAQPKVPRLVLLGALNSIGISALNHMTTLEFNMPESVRDGTETLAYSYRMQVSMHPRSDYAADLAALDAPTLMLAGTNDNSFNSDAYAPLFHEHTKQTTVRLLKGIGHLGLINDAKTRQVIGRWLTRPGNKKNRVTD